MFCLGDFLFCLKNEGGERKVDSGALDSFLMLAQMLLFFPTEVVAFPNTEDEFKEYVETVLVNVHFQMEKEQQTELITNWGE